MSKTIPLTRGKAVVVDDADHAALAAMGKWGALGGAGGKFYAVRNEPKPGGGQTLVYMHRKILGVGPGVRVRFRNGDSLDLRRENISAPSAAANPLGDLVELPRAWHPLSTPKKRIPLPAGIVPVKDAVLKDGELFFDLEKKLYLRWDKALGKKGGWRGFGSPASAREWTQRMLMPENKLAGLL